MRRGERRGGGFLSKLSDGLRGMETKDDAALLEVVGGHFHFHAVTGEDANAMQAHAPREVTVELQIFCLA